MNRFTLFSLFNRKQKLITSFNKEDNNIIYNPFSTFDEELTEEENSQYNLTFSIAGYVDLNGQKVKNYWLDILKQGSLLKLILDDFKEINLIIVKLEPQLFKDNIIYTFECQDELSYLWTKRNLGYSYSNLETGVQTIYEITKQILKDCFLYTEWKVIDTEALLTQSPLRSKKISLSIKNSNPYNAIIEACNILSCNLIVDYHFKTLTFFQKNNIPFSGYRYRPEVNLSELNVTYDSKEFFSLLRVFGGEDQFGAKISLSPAIPDAIWNWLISDGSDNFITVDWKKAILKESDTNVNIDTWSEQEWIDTIANKTSILYPFLTTKYYQQQEKIENILIDSNTLINSYYPFYIPNDNENHPAVKNGTRELIAKQIKIDFKNQGKIKFAKNIDTYLQIQYTEDKDKKKKIFITYCWDNVNLTTEAEVEDATIYIIPTLDNDIITIQAIINNHFNTLFTFNSNENNINSTIISSEELPLTLKDIFKRKTQGTIDYIDTTTGSWATQTIGKWENSDNQILLKYENIDSCKEIIYYNSLSVADLNNEDFKNEVVEVMNFLNIAIQIPYLDQFLLDLDYFKKITNNDEFFKNFTDLLNGKIKNNNIHLKRLYSEKYNIEWQFSETINKIYNAVTALYPLYQDFENAKEKDASYQKRILDDIIKIEDSIQQYFTENNYAVFQWMFMLEGRISSLKEEPTEEPTEEEINIWVNDIFSKYSTLQNWLKQREYNFNKYESLKKVLSNLIFQYSAMSDKTVFDYKKTDLGQQISLNAQQVDTYLTTILPIQNTTLLNSRTEDGEDKLLETWKSKYAIYIEEKLIEFNNEDIKHYQSTIENDNIIIAGKNLGVYYRLICEFINFLKEFLDKEIALDNYKNINSLIQQYEDNNYSQWNYIYNNYGYYIQEGIYENEDELDSVSLYNQAVSYFEKQKRPLAEYDISILDLSVLEAINVPKLTVGSKIKVYNKFLNLKDLEEDNITYDENDLIVTGITTILRQQEKVTVSVEKVRAYETILEKLLLSIKK